MTVTRLPIAALACSLGSRMNTTLWNGRLPLSGDDEVAN